MALRTPVIVINLKTYGGGYGEDAVRLAILAEAVAKETGASIALAVSNVDLYRIAQAVKLPILAQHVDPIEEGSHTGYILPEAVRATGAIGTLLNHAEHQLDVDTLRHTVSRCKEVGLSTIICVKDASEAAGAIELEPEFVAIEPPSLIGGDVSVTSANPHLLAVAHEAVRGTPLLCGAGVKTAADVRKSLELGLDGVLLASGVVKSEDPEKALRDLASGLG